MKVIHISDLHFGMNHSHIIEAFFKDIALIQPHIIIISGDLTQRATTQQFQLLQNFLYQLPGIVLVVPGNHDIPLNIFKRLFSPFSQYNQFVGEQYPSTYQDNFVKILGVNSVNPYHMKNGELSSSTLRVIEEFFSSDTSQLNILFFHHNVDNIHSLHHPLKNNLEFLRYLKESNIHIVCTGHLHHAHTALIEKDNHYSCLILHAGSLCCTRSKDDLNSYYVVNNQDLTCEIEWRVFNIDKFETQSISQIDFSQTNTKLNSVLLPKETTL